MYYCIFIFNNYPASLYICPHSHWNNHIYELTTNSYTPILINMTSMNYQKPLRYLHTYPKALQSCSKYSPQMSCIMICLLPAWRERTSRASSPSAFHSLLLPTFCHSPGPSEVLEKWTVFINRTKSRSGLVSGK